VATDGLSLTVRGEGAPVVLVHGGVGPQMTWERQDELADRWKLLIPARRGYPGSPPAERQDFERDAEDLEPVVADGAHLVGFSYGGLGAALFAGRHPGRVWSLTLIEVPLFALAGDDPGVAEARALSESFVASRGGETEEPDERFLELAGVGGGRVPPEQLEELLRLTRNLRPPSEAEPDAKAIRESRTPVMVVSGRHNASLERLCDLVAAALGGRRERCPGAGHAVPRAAGFNVLLDGFLRDAASSG
jgi:pimeloyl-ACP methyl ester carboxylesterase